KRLPFSGFQSSLIADRRGSAIRPAIETLQKANRSCGRVRMATSAVDHGFTGYLLECSVLDICFSFDARRSFFNIIHERLQNNSALMGIWAGLIINGLSRKYRPPTGLYVLSLVF
ncbi:MAG: hypothetical protein JRI35_06465, partial [Deltaproteobacteria bacterium]|nr:hypothetical protein [Deltaproteobacteria bacterium]